MCGRECIHLGSWFPLGHSLILFGQMNLDETLRTMAVSGHHEITLDLFVLKF